MVLFAEVASLAERLALEGSRLKKRAAIAERVARVAGVAPGSRDDPTYRHRAAMNGAPVLGGEARGPGSDSILDAGRFCLYLAGQPFPEADARKLNAGGAILSKVLKEVSGANDAAMSAAYRRHGDLGAAAYDLLAPPYGKAAGQATITLAGLAEAFDAMATARSTAGRTSTVEALLRRATAQEAKYLLKLMLGDMRIGVKQSLIEEAIAVAAVAQVEAVRHAVMLEADLQRAVVRAFEGTLDEARMRLFHPLGFMLASSVETPEEAVERFTEKPKKVPAKSVKRGRGKKGAGEVSDGLPDVLGVDAAEGGFAEDVELEVAREMGGDEPIHRDEAAMNGEPDGVAGSVIHALLEDKFDGLRAQVHCGDPAQPGRVAVYSRSREDITESFPEIEEAFRNVSARPDGLSGLIFDGEILGWDVAGDKALPFAVLGQRIGRKRVADDLRRSVPVVFMAFDLMYADGELMLPRPLRERRARLEQIVSELQPGTFATLATPPKGPQGVLFGSGGRFADGSGAGTAGTDRVQRLRLSRAQMVESAEGVDQGYRDARARANEGVMLKAVNSAYLPGRRGLAWLKLKRELATLDVVITGAEFGNGRRAQFLSDYTFAVRGAGGELLNVGKAYSGVTDAEIAELTEWLKAHTIEDFGHFRTVEPIRVLEVAFNNIMRSERHASGFALRFPRIVRVRDDKPVEEIDTLERVEEVYGSQPDKPEES